MARTPRGPKPPPPEAQALLDEGLNLTDGDTGAAILLALHKLNEDDDFARVRGAWMRWLRRNIGSRRPHRRRPAGP